MNAMHQFAMSKFATSQSRDDAMLEEIDMLQGKVKDLSAVLNHHKTLKAENARLKAELAKYQACMNPSERLVLRLRAELAAAQKDAERYRWLRSPDRGMANLSTVINDDCQPPYYELKCGTELDAAIDKELAK